MKQVIPALSTARLNLRPLQVSDGPSAQNLLNDWEIAKYMAELPWPLPETGGRDYIEENLKKVELGDEVGWAICLNTNPEEMVGHILFTKGWEPNQWVRFFWIGRNFQNKGYMTEAVVPTTSYIFDELKVGKLIISNVVGNAASRRIKEKTGARFLGIEDCRRVRADFKKKEVWELTPDLWNAWKAGQEPVIN